MSTVEAIGAAIAAAAETLPAMRSQLEWDEDPNVSGNALVAVVEYDGTDYDTAFGGTASAVKYKVTVLGPAERATRAKLTPLCDPTPGSTTTLRSAVNGTLGSLVADCRVTQNGSIRQARIGEGPEAMAYLGVEFNIEVMPS